MNRHERRAKAKHRFVAKCKACDADTCVIHVQAFRTVDPNGPKDFGICKGCACAAGKCDSCGETGEHWLGCPIVGLDEARPTGATLQ